MTPVFFATPREFRRWLRQHHGKATELWVGFHKKGTGRPSLTWPESVDEALSVGWIDGIRKSLDADSYVVRFTPRTPTSTWSAVNTRRARQLIDDRRMQPAGFQAFEARDKKRSGTYSFEQRRTAALETAEISRFKRNRAAWRFFESQPPGYRHTATWWVISAKRADTRERRLRTLIDDSSAGLRIAPLRRAR